MKRESTYQPQSEEAKAFGDWLLKRIEYCGYNQSRFAERVGVSKATVSRWIRHGRIPAGQYMQELADALGLTYNTVAEKAGVKDRVNEDALEDIHAELDHLLVQMDEADVAILVDTARSLVRAAEIRRSHAADTRDESRSTTNQTVDSSHPME